MAVTYTALNPAQELTRLATGEFATTDTTTVDYSAAGTHALGFKPRVIILWDETTQSTYHWSENMGATNILKEADDGTQTLDTTQVITASAHGFTFVPEASKTYQFAAWG